MRTQSIQILTKYKKGKTSQLSWQLRQIYKCLTKPGSRCTAALTLIDSLSTQAILIRLMKGSVVHKMLLISTPWRWLWANLTLTVIILQLVLNYLYSQTLIRYIKMSSFIKLNLFGPIKTEDLAPCLTSLITKWRVTQGETCSNSKGNWDMNRGRLW